MLYILHMLYMIIIIMCNVYNIYYRVLLLYRALVNMHDSREGSKNEKLKDF